ncbi:unnamed protein product [Notodromas monacha]|uniref:protein-tyrosine-phosphatase n=1 Tax=Notodromas monacha TaxID=399045 RepID=A0A7R9BYT1_9CRUS|nr:unnamed protein product [Notodromas monacha]CAG0923856.1 unnamed protein product [Notodromas monacha]
MVQEVGGNVLVHCFAGISRSPTLVIGYVMDRLHLSSEEAFRYVKSKRAVVAPNFNFLGQLLEYDQYLKTRLKTNLHKVHTAPATSAPLEFSWEITTSSPKQSPSSATPGPKFYLRSPSLAKSPNLG